MARRIIIISSGPLFIVLMVVALVFVGIGRGQPVSIESARNQIITLADEGKLTEVDTAIRSFGYNCRYGFVACIECCGFIWLRARTAMSTLLLRRKLPIRRLPLFLLWLRYLNKFLHC